MGVHPSRRLDAGEHLAEQTASFISDAIVSKGVMQHPQRPCQLVYKGEEGRNCSLMPAEGALTGC